MSEPTTATELAESSAKAIRTLSRMTGPSDGWAGIENASQVAAVVSELEALASSLPQTLHQLRTWIVDHSSELRYDAAGSTAVIDDTVAALETARDQASRLADVLRPAYDDASRLIGPSI